MRWDDEANEISVWKLLHCPVRWLWGIIKEGKQKNAVYYDYNLLGIIFYFKSDMTMVLTFFIIGNYITTIVIKAFLKRLLGHKLQVWVIDQVKDLG